MAKPARARRPSYASEFRPLDLAGSRDFPAGKGVPEDVCQRMARFPRGVLPCWGIPFDFAAPDAPHQAIVLDDASEPVTLALSGQATHICVVHFWQGPPSPAAGEAGNELVAEYTLCYADGSETTVPIRTRFEIGWGQHWWGQQLFGAVSYDGVRSLNFDSPEARAKHEWGWLQTDVAGAGVEEPWLFALINPQPAKTLASVVLRGRHASPVGVLAITLYRGPGHPLRHNARRFYRLDTGDAKVTVAQASVDLGVLVRPPLPLLARGAAWVKDPARGLGAEAQPPAPASQVILEASGADGAALSVKTETARGAKALSLSLGEAFHDGRASAGRATLEVVHPRRTWLHVTVRDTETGEPTPARVHFSGPHGEYYAPYGHHEVINTSWFEDYGADVQLGGMPYAYVHGRFQTELPVGEVFVEVVKGFEYVPLRQKVTIRPGQKELELRLQRGVNLRRSGWVTADTHVHFISPHTAWLQGQGEGVNLINLLASQWGRLFTNFGDLTGAPGVEKDDTIVWVGTENRNHILGHMSLLGTHGPPVLPMCTGGAQEAYIGDPDYLALTEWADENRARQGVVIRPHFPQPNTENPVQIVLGKLDGVELRNFGDPAAGFGTANFLEWYRYLNCGYRVAAVGGTDKMSAGMPVGGVRTYARLDRNRAFTFENWAEAIRRGRTFTTSGPLLDLTVDGHGIGDEIRLKRGGGTLEMQAEASGVWPLHRLELVVNGKVVAVADAPKGRTRLTLRHRLTVPGTCWIAARCGSSLRQHHCWPMNLGAHTSPVYVTVPGSELFSPSDATYMLTLIEGGMTYLDTLSVRYDAERQQRIRAVYEKAHAELHRRMKAHHHTP